VHVRHIFAGAVFSAAAIATMALAGETAGELRALTGSASATGDGGERTLVTGSAVEAGDLVKTSEMGEAQILMRDGVRLVVGPDSSMKINTFEMKSADAGATVDVAALDGIFRLVSEGTGDKGYSIATPTATIKMSGTAFDFMVEKSGVTRLLLLEGAVTMCGKDGDRGCQTVASPCALLRTDDGKGVTQVGSAVPDEPGVPPEVDKEIRQHFRYQRSQADLRDEFRVGGKPCIEGATGGIAPTALEQPGIAVPIAVAIPVAAAVMYCLIACTKNDNPNSTNHTN
jgi:hypothetical protein